MKKINQGAALVSILAIMAVALIVVSASTLVAISTSRASFDQVRSQRLWQATESLVDEAVLRFLRSRNFANPYLSWTDNCLQIANFSCKMELNLTESGGEIDVWGKMETKLRHLRFTVAVDPDESISVTNKREIY